LPGTSTLSILRKFVNYGHKKVLKYLAQNKARKILGKYVANFPMSVRPFKQTGVGGDKPLSLIAEEHTIIKKLMSNLKLSNHLFDNRKKENFTEC
jgi:hypothetical protein